MGQVVTAIPKSQLNELALALIIADAVRSARRVGVWNSYQRAKAKIARLNPTADQYERAIKLLTEALKI